jgi:hypothetical protein
MIFNFYFRITVFLNISLLESRSCFATKNSRKWQTNWLKVKLDFDKVASNWFKKKKSFGQIILVPEKEI